MEVNYVELDCNGTGNKKRNLEFIYGKTENRITIAETDIM